MPLMTELTGPSEVAGALRAIDGLPELHARYSALLRAMPTGVARSGPEIAHDAAVTLAAGKAIDLAEVAREVDEAERDARHGAHAHEIHGRAVTFLAADIDAVTRAGLDAAFAHMRGRLGEILHAARQVSAAVSPTATAEDVLRGGDVAQLRAWRELDELAAVYRQLRAAQTTLTKIGLSDQVSGVSAMVTAHGEIRGRDLLWTRPAGPVPLTGTAADPPWPHQPGTDQPTHTARYLLWLVAAEVDVWLPLPHELREEAAAAYQRQQDAEQSQYPAAARAL